ncbi:MAG: hypothetical protein ACKOCP_04675 [Candidatus Nanopelagicus sp.]
MKGSIIASLLGVLVAAFLIIRLSNKNAMSKYEKNPKNKWNSLSQGIDPTDE